eukprot:Gb_03494 [translate_table: standard]
MLENQLPFFLLSTLEDHHHDGKATSEENESPATDATAFWESLKQLWIAFTSINVRPLVELFRRILNGRAMQILIKLPLHALSFRVLKRSLGFINSGDQTSMSKPDETSALTQPPLRDELHIPSVTLLCKAGLKFAPVNGNLTTIRFDPTTTMLYFPPVILDTNTEVILRNLVA